MLPQPRHEPPARGAAIPATVHFHDHTAPCASVAANHPPTFNKSRFAPPSTVCPDSTDEFRTHWDSLGNLVRTPVPTSCGYEDCTFVGLPDALWRHIVDAHHAGTKATTPVQCSWDGCGPTISKPMNRRSLQRHILDTHLRYMKMHCAYCHYTSRDVEYARRHGNDPALCLERAAWEAHEGEGWTRTRAGVCEWCQAITIRES